jgi:hypothetical protein
MALLRNSWISYRLHIKPIADALGNGRDAAFELGVGYVFDEGKQVLRSFLPMVIASKKG